MGSALHGGSFRQAHEAALKGGLQGGLAGGLAGRIGQFFGTPADFSIKLEIIRATLHGLAAGAVNTAFGGDFTSAFLAGSISSLVTHSFRFNPGGGMDLDKVGFWGDLAVASIVGGTASEIGGGKFGNGAFYGAAQYLFNAASKSWESPRPRKPGLLQSLFPAHTAPMSRQPIGGSMESQLAYANHVNGIRTAAIGGVTASIGLNAVGPAIAEFGPLLPVMYDKVVLNYYVWGASTSLDVTLYTTLNNPNAFSTTSNFNILYKAGVARIPVFVEAYSSHISAASSWAAVAGEFAGVLNTE